MEDKSRCLAETEFGIQEKRIEDFGEESDLKFLKINENKPLITAGAMTGKQIVQSLIRQYTHLIEDLYDQPKDPCT